MVSPIAIVFCFVSSLSLKIFFAMESFNFIVQHRDFGHQDILDSVAAKCSQSKGWLHTLKFQAQ